MQLAAKPLSSTQTSQRPEPINVGTTIWPATPVAILDPDSYELLASMAHEISREFAGDGLLLTWHENGGERRHLFAGGACETASAVVRDLAEIAETAARPRVGGARSHWRAISDNPLIGVLTTSIPAERGIVTMSVLFKRVDRSTRMAAGETAARLLPLVQPFFRIWLSQMRAAIMVKALTAIIDDSDVGIVLVDRSGQIILSNTVASALMNLGDGIRRRDAAITATNITDTLRLYNAIEAVSAPRSHKRAGPVQSLIKLRRGKAAPLLVAVAANPESSTDEADFAATIYIVDTDQDVRPLIEPVCAMYQLSPGETRLAYLLVSGCSLADAAARLGVREQTARSYLKQVFLKTETNRQADLVRILLLSAVRAGHAAITPK